MHPIARKILQPPWRAWKAVRHATRLAAARRALRRFAAPYKINAGCGPAPFTGWVNIDNNRELDPLDLFWDLSQGLPVPDESCEVIFSEHVLEHLNLQQGLHFLNDCRRALIPGGVLRTAMPSLDDMIEKSANGRWNDQVWLHEPQWQFIASRAEMFNIMFRWWGHQWIYDREELHRRLREVGFQTIRDMAWGESELECLRHRENRPSSLLICEAVKT
jgi:predicted SAM-dependent methyltransferase